MFKRGLPVLVLLVLLFQFPLSIQELIPLEGSDSCGLCPGGIVMYECTIINSNTTTIYEITWPDSTTCTLRLVNSRFIGSSDECQNKLAIAFADRIDGDKYISNITIIVPNVTFPISSIIVRCSSEDIPEPVGTTTLDIISSGGFTFPGTLERDPEEGTCVFSVNSSCNVDDYLPSSSCSNCSFDGSVFTCSDVQPGENCSFAVRATICNFISLESDLMFCNNIGAIILNEKGHNSESIHLAAIITPVMIAVVIVMVGTTVLIVFFIRRAKHKKEKQKLNISHVPLSLNDMTDDQPSLSPNDRLFIPPVTSSNYPPPVAQEVAHVEFQQPPVVHPNNQPSPPASTPNGQPSPPVATLPSLSAATLDGQLSPPASASNGQPFPPAATLSDQPSPSASTPSGQPSPPAATPDGQPSPTASASNGQPSPPAATPSDQPSPPASAPYGQSSPPIATLPSPAATPDGQLSLLASPSNGQPSPAATPSNQPTPPASVHNGQPSPPIATLPSPAATPDGQLSLPTSVPNDRPSPPAATPDDQLSSPASASNDQPSPNGQPSPPTATPDDQPSLPASNGQSSPRASVPSGQPAASSDDQASPELESELEFKLRKIVNDCMSEHMVKYYELVKQLDQKNTELEREKRAKNLIYTQLQQEKHQNAELKKQLEEKEKRIEELERRTRTLELEMDYVKRQLPILKEPTLCDVKLDKQDAKLQAVVDVSQHQDAKNIEHGACLNDQIGHSDPSRKDIELNYRDKCTQIITERNNVPFYESDSSNIQQT